MTRGEAIALHGELETLRARGPGGIDEDVRHQLQRIEFALGGAPETDSYLREKVGQACNYLGIWLSPRKWQQWDRDPKIFQGIVSNAVYSVRRAIDATFPEPPRDP